MSPSFINSVRINHFKWNFYINTKAKSFGQTLITSSFQVKIHEAEESTFFPNLDATDVLLHCLHIHFPRSEPRLSLCFFQLFFKCIVSLQSHLTFEPHKDKNANYSTNTAATLKRAQRGGTASSSFSYQTALAVTFALEAAVVPVWATKNSHLKTQHLTEQNKQTNHLLLPPSKRDFLLDQQRN